jgi:4-hydroxybenzoate polyprenyltransferase
MSTTGKNASVFSLGGFSAICRMIKIEHSIFALPFAYSGAFLAKRGWPGVWTLLVLTIAMVGIRSYAMAFNRIADLPYDSKNPRTAKRALVTGLVSPWQAWRFCGVMAAMFVVACAALNTACLYLSPLALVLASLYSYSKRVTWACHFFLGSVIGLAPVAGWLAVSPAYPLALPPLLLGIAVAFWIAGFDILYACQDILFDQGAGLRSLPASFGLASALHISAFCHIITIIFLVLTGLACSLGWAWHACLAVTACVLWWEHAIVSPEDISRLRTAFALNGPVSILLLAGVLLGIYVP